MKSDEQHLWGIVLAAGEGTQTREFLQQLCSGRSVKQFCVITGERSMLQHTLARVERLIPRERILVVVSRNHRDEVQQQLASWPKRNVLFQPANRDTAPGILLPLMHVMRRDPGAIIASFPSDHFIMDEDRFAGIIARAIAEAQYFPRELILLGMTPDRAEESYGWIEPAGAEAGRDSRAIRKFWEKPTPADARALMARGALWNTFVFVAQSATLWRLFRRAAPDLCNIFDTIFPLLDSSYAELLTAHAYQIMPSLNFASGVCEPLASWLRVLPASECGWSDWGSAERILASLQRIRKLDERRARLTQRKAAA